jgi:hypothetical protein
LVFRKIYSRYRSAITLNRDLFISGAVGYIATIAVAYATTGRFASDVANSAVIVITGFVLSKIAFAILFHIARKKAQKRNVPLLKQKVRKMIFADVVFDIVNNLSRFFIMLELLNMQYQPAFAALIGSLLGTLLSYIAINLIVKKMHVFRSTRKES